MTATTIADLHELFFRLQYEIDDGKTAPIDDAQNAIIDGEVIKFIQNHADIDLSRFSQDGLDAIDDTISS